MPSMTAPTRTNGTKAPSAARPAGARGRPAARRRQLPLVVVGVLLVIGGALAFADASLHLGSREEVLVVSEPLAAGQVITSSDLETVRVSTGTGLQVVPAGEEASVVGSPGGGAARCRLAFDPRRAGLDCSGGVRIGRGGGGVEGRPVPPRPRPRRPGASRPGHLAVVILAHPYREPGFGHGAGR